MAVGQLERVSLLARRFRKTRLPASKRAGPGLVRRGPTIRVCGIVRGH